MVGLFLLITLAGVGEPFTVDVPDSVQSGETFSLTVTCYEPECTGITARNIETSNGLSFMGSSSSTSISTVNTGSGRQLTQTMVYQIRFSATGTGTEYIRPVRIHLGGLGDYTLDEIEIELIGTGTVQGSGDSTASRNELVWLEAVLHDPGGLIYPGTRLTIDYYVYARTGVENVTYWWNAPELGVILDVETILDSNWEPAGKHVNSQRSLLAIVEMTPAAAGSLYAPLFEAEVTGTEYDYWGKLNAWNIENEPIVLPVYPFPDNPPDNWDGTLLDSISVKVEQLPVPPGQGGELTFRVTCNGPGSIYMEERPELTVRGSSSIIPAGGGSADNKKWWDFILEPEDTGTSILGPDTLVWLDRTCGEYRSAIIEPCSLVVAVIPRNNQVIELESEEEGISSSVWITAVGSAALLMAVFLGISAGRKARRMSSIAEAEDMDELMSGLENELSVLLSGSRNYLGFEELDKLLSDSDSDTLLARRVLRFWKDLETSMSEKEVSSAAFSRMKKTAQELISELNEDMKKNGKEE